MALFVLQYSITIKYIVWQKTTGTRVVSKATRVHKVVNKVIKVVRDKVHKVDSSQLATRVTRALKADAVIRTRAILPAAEAQVVIKTAVEATAKRLLLFKNLSPALPDLFYIVPFYHLHSVIDSMIIRFRTGTFFRSFALSIFLINLSASLFKTYNSFNNR